MSEHLVFILESKGKQYEVLIDPVDEALFRSHTWHYHEKNYVATNLRGGGIGRLSRMIMRPAEDLFVDHANRNPLDNRRCNLRICTRTQNNQNRVFARSSGGFKGVRVATSGRFVARIRVNKKLLTLGTFDTALEAANVYNEAAKLHFGEFASLNQV